LETIKDGDRISPRFARYQRTGGPDDWPSKTGSAAQATRTCYKHLKTLLFHQHNVKVVKNAFISLALIRDASELWVMQWF